MKKQSHKSNEQYERRDPPLPPLSSPDPVLLCDLSPEDQAKTEVYLLGGHTRKWRFIKGQVNV